MINSSCDDSSQSNVSYHRKGSKRRSYTGEDSGGVINFSSPARIEYSNRIRHSGLGGFEYYDFMFMSANERFIALNTKTGNLLNQCQETERFDHEGLFIIDLEEGCPKEGLFSK